MAWRKGASFERELCTKLSEWWSDGERSDIFWRTAGSGGRATKRTAKGKGTHGQQGDVQAVDPVGAPLTRLCTIEAKRGYPDAHLGDLLDLNPKVVYRERPMLAFMAQSSAEAKGEGVPYWMLVVQRKKRLAVVYTTPRFLRALSDWGANPDEAVPRIRLQYAENRVVVATTLDQFFEHVRPDHVKQAYSTFKKRGG